MVDFSKNKWKYSTIGLLAVLAVGFSFPQASAHVTNNVMHMLTHIFDNTEEIKESIDNLPTDPASQSASGSPTGTQQILVADGPITVIIPAPPEGFERTAMLTLKHEDALHARPVNLGLREAGTTTYELNLTLFNGQPYTAVINVPEGKELVVENADDGDQFGDFLQVTAIWWESASG